MHKMTQLRYVLTRLRWMRLTTQPTEMAQLTITAKQVEAMAPENNSSFRRSRRAQHRTPHRS